MSVPLPPKAPPIHDAVTAVLSHGDDIYITRRQPYLAAFSGYWAFPGGKVDKTDGTEPLESAVFAKHPPRLMRALARELMEETGFDLVGAAERGLVRSIACLGEMTTPAFAVLRFRSWCYRVDLAEIPELKLDPGEAVEGQWVSAHTLKQRFDEGRLLVAPPTRATIEALAADPRANTVPAMAIPDDFDTNIPWIDVLPGLRILMVRSNTLPPADRTNCFWVGGDGHPRIVIDPAPTNREEFGRLTVLLEEFGVDEIFLTHHHVDHRELADDLARRFKVPIGLSADTRERIARRSPNYFDGVETRIHGDGEVLTYWLGRAVDLVAVPGHDEGQLAPMARDGSWCIVGDLIQGIGTVVIAAPEGNMKKYFASLQKIIDLNPSIIIPSHGMALGTTHFLKVTLEHRRKREQQVKALFEAGQSPAEMVPAIYPGLTPGLLPFARMNVDSHLAKLREDGVIS